MWQNFEFFALTTLFLWVTAIFILIINRAKALLHIATLGGIVSLAIFIIMLWLNVQRPPLRTLGETRLWYSFFLSISGYIIYKRWNVSLMLIYSLAMAILFLVINYLKPDIHSKTLMPALQSIWFVPHVIVYMIAYALLGLSALFGLWGLISLKKGINNPKLEDNTSNIVYIGFGFLTLGLLFGAIWAKEAWGHYWSWDPKETWAFITWSVYLCYIHFSIKSTLTAKQVYSTLVVAFIVLLICWFGINYLPSAQHSVHVYSR